MATNVSNEESEEVDHTNVAKNVLINDIDDDIIKKDVDDDGDMNDTFKNIDYEPEYDTYVDLDA